MILLIDNYDSFTHNLVQLLGAIGLKESTLRQDLVVVRNDQATVRALAQRKPDYLIVTPGPCSPREAGISNDAIAHFHGRIPILGVCLGHQCIAHVFGARVVRAGRILHGKTSAVHHDGRTLFRRVCSPFIAMRYHSLAVPADSLPPGWEQSAWTDAGECMGLRCTTAPTEGVQFHPESFLTTQGERLLTNFLRQ